MFWYIRKPNFKFFKIIKPKAIHKPSAQHVLDDDYYKIEAIQFTMAHDDGKKVDDLNSADVILQELVELVKLLRLYICQTEV